MTKFAFTRRMTVLQTVWFEAETENEAWRQALDGKGPDKIGDGDANKPIFRRLPVQDEFDL